MVARLAHDQEFAGSSPASATSPLGIADIHTFIGEYFVNR